MRKAIKVITYSEQELAKFEKEVGEALDNKFELINTTTELKNSVIYYTAFLFGNVRGESSTRTSRF